MRIEVRRILLIFNGIECASSCVLPVQVRNTSVCIYNRRSPPGSWHSLSKCPKDRKAPMPPLLLLLLSLPVSWAAVRAGVNVTGTTMGPGFAR